MKKTITAVDDKSWRFCPECNHEHVQAVENGFRVDDIPTDLMFCYNCQAYFVVFPDWYFKGRGKTKKLASFPKKIDVELSEANEKEAEDLL